MTNVLVANSEKYSGQYVTTENWDSSEVICSSKSAYDAYTCAVEKGFNDPVVIYVPTEEDFQSRYR